MSILKSLLCLRIVQPRAKLRVTAKTRNALYFSKGLEELDRECDIGYIVHNVRILRYFLKTVLDKDQRVLLKLKTSECIDSGDEKPSTMKTKKKVNKSLLLDRYIENLQRKTLGKQDIRLLEVLGFNKALKILTDQRETTNRANENSSNLL